MRPENFFEFVWDLIDAINLKSFLNSAAALLKKFNMTVERIDLSREELDDILDENPSHISQEIIENWQAERKEVSTIDELSADAKYSIVVDNAIYTGY